ncbi:hypothetical protein [Nocardia thraciensis]
MTYTFQIDIGTKPDGTRDRQRFTYPTAAVARREYRRISTEVAEGKYVRFTNLTVDEACDEWLDGRRGIRTISLRGLINDLKPVRRKFGGRKLADLTKADGDALVEWMLTAGRVDRHRYDPESLTTRIADFIANHPDGISTRAINAEFPDGNVRSSLSALLRTGRITRLRRGVYAPGTQATSIPAGGQTSHRPRHLDRLRRGFTVLRRPRFSPPQRDRARGTTTRRHRR